MGDHLTVNVLKVEQFWSLTISFAFGRAFGMTFRTNKIIANDVCALSKLYAMLTMIYCDLTEL